MSNTEAAREVYQAHINKDLAGVVARCTEEVEFHITPGTPFSRTYKGKEDVAAFLKALADHLDVPRFEPHLYVSEGDCVVAFVNCTCVSKKNGKSVDLEVVHRMTFVEGKIHVLKEYTDSLAYSKIFE